MILVHSLSKTYEQLALNSELVDTCDHITHTEVMASEGAQYLGGLLSGDYKLLWVATPADWHVRLPGKRPGPHFQHIQNLMTKARALRMSLVLVGPP
eukprot:4057364-Pyramimonas_sp.AAC.1